jgi:hypothetical protein
MLHIRRNSVGRARGIDHPWAGIAGVFRFTGFADLAMIAKCSHNEFNRETAMSQGIGSWVAMVALAGALAFSSGATAQTAAAPAENAAPTADNAVMLTVFLKHDQSRPLSELNAQLERQGFYKAFPPAGIEVVSWYVMMGIGQVVTLRLPASRLREVNRLFETMAWGAYRTEFYPTYDYKAVGIAAHDKAQQAGAEPSK